MSTWTAAGVFVSNGIGTNGATVDAWKASRFGGVPAVNAAPPVGLADATGITTAGTYGANGSFQIALPTSEPYYIRIQYAGVAYWQLYNYVDFTDGSNPPSPSLGAYVPRAGGTSAGASALPFFNVKDYGAKGDGTTDDTSAISAAITAAGAAGGIVWFPAGTYLISSSLTIPTGVRLQGVMGKVGSIFGETLNGSVITASGSITYNAIATSGTTHGTEVRDLFFDISTDATHWVMKFGAVSSGLVIQNVGIRQSATGANGIDLDGGTAGIYGARLDNIGINCGGGFTGGVGLRIGDSFQCNSNLGTQVQVQGYTTGIDFNNGGGNTILGPWVQSCTTGVRFNSSLCATYGGWYETCTTALLFTAGSTNGIVIGGRSSGNGTQVTDTGSGTHVFDLDGYSWGTLSGGAITANGNGVLAAITFFDRATATHWVWYGSTTCRLFNGTNDIILVDTSGRMQITGQFYPAAETLAAQTSGGMLHSTGIPSNTNGNNNDWCISDNGHLYFKSAGAWVQKV